MGLSPQEGSLVPWFISQQTIPNPVSLVVGTVQCPDGLGLPLTLREGGVVTFAT